MMAAPPAQGTPSPGKTIAVFASGGGTNFQALIDAGLPIRLLVVNRRDAGARERARNADIQDLYLPNVKAAPGVYDHLLAEVIHAHQVDLVVLAGFLVIIGERFFSECQVPVLNIHPALLPRHGGPGMYGHRVHEAVLASGARESGCSVHLVTLDIDGGPILGQIRVPVAPGDTPDSLAARVLAKEHVLFPAVIKELLAGRIDPADLPAEPWSPPS